MKYSGTAAFFNKQCERPFSPASSAQKRWYRVYIEGLEKGALASYFSPAELYPRMEIARGGALLFLSSLMAFVRGSVGRFYRKVGRVVFN